MTAPTGPTALASTTPLHDKVWVASHIDDDRGKLYRAQCACGSLDGPWHDDHTLALAEARTHRSTHRSTGPVTAHG